MSQVKEEAIAVIEALPEDCSLEDIQYHLYVKAKVDRGIKAAEQGNTITQDQAESRVREWRKSSGQTHL